MDLKKTIRSSIEMSRSYRVDHGKKFRLKNYDPGDTGKFSSGNKSLAKEILNDGILALSELQETLYAHNRWSILLIFQAMDAAGKDSTIKHVMSGVNPQGCQVASFKVPNATELDHDFLWRCQLQLPERGRIGIFNRSYYEETLVVKVHPELLEYQQLPERLTGKNIWKKRYKDICNFEKHLSRNGTVIRKFFLNVSREEQKKRFLERLDKPSKNWKFSSGDVRERERWDEYMKAYEDTIRETATTDAPWYVVPADNKWYTQMIVASAIIDAMSSLGLHYPVLDAEKKKELALARKMLMAGNA